MSNLSRSTSRSILGSSAPSKKLSGSDTQVWPHLVVLVSNYLPFKHTGLPNQDDSAIKIDLIPVKHGSLWKYQTFRSAGSTLSSVVKSWNSSHCRFELICSWSGRFGPCVLQRWAPSRAKSNLGVCIRFASGFGSDSHTDTRRRWTVLDGWWDGSEKSDPEGISSTGRKPYVCSTNNVRTLL